MDTMDYFKDIIDNEINNESKLVTTLTIIDEISNILPSIPSQNQIINENIISYQKQIYCIFL
jgi:hypothetical protein